MTFAVECWNVKVIDAAWRVKMGRTSSSRGRTPVVLANFEHQRPGFIFVPYATGKFHESLPLDNIDSLLRVSNELSDSQTPTLIGVYAAARWHTFSTTHLLLAYPVGDAVLGEEGKVFSADRINTCLDMFLLMS
jgi:hypothetical protein